MVDRIKVLDCTFRDGGYYNQWDFDIQLVQKYLDGVDRANVDVIELGFRNFPQNNFLGAFAYTTDAYIEALNIHERTIVGVMIDASVILSCQYPIDQAINLLFQAKNKSRVNLVRVATHFNDVEQCREIVRVLKKLGYQVALNLMQSNTKTDNEITNTAKLIQSWEMLDVLYFADSLGGMGTRDVVRIISALRLNWLGELGFHAHNNKGLAVSNTLKAIENGVTWVDSTVLGMGRGAGNAQTENLLLEISRKFKLDYHADALFDLVLTDFVPLQRRYHWGESLLYGLAAMHNIHPTYIQEMLADNRYSSKEILQAVEFMSSLDASHYSNDLLIQARGNTKNNKGQWNARNWCIDKEVMILGSGGGIRTYRNAILQYIKTYQPIVLSLNVKQDFPEEMINCYIASNESKMLVESEQYSQLKKPLVISRELLSKVVNIHKIKVRELLDYGVNIKPGIFDIQTTECTLPYELSIGYAIALATIGGANTISLVGFDGYHKDDIRQVKMNELLDLYTEQSLIPITALTPTTYSIPQGSIYAKKI